MAEQDRTPTVTKPRIPNEPRDYMPDRPATRRELQSLHRYLVNLPIEQRMADAAKDKPFRDFLLSCRVGLLIKVTVDGTDSQF